MKKIHIPWNQYNFEKYCAIHFWSYRPALACGIGSLHVLEGTMNAERYIKVLEQHMLPSRRRVFQQDNAKPHTAAILTAWLHSRRVQVLNWPVCSPDLSPLENIWRILKRKIHQRWPQTRQQLETYIRQEWDQIPTPKLQKLITLMPKLGLHNISHSIFKVHLASKAGSVISGNFHHVRNFTWSSI